MTSHTAQERNLPVRKEVEVVEKLVDERSELIVLIPTIRTKTGKQLPRRNEERQPRKVKALPPSKQKEEE